MTVELQKGLGENVKVSDTIPLIQFSILIQYHIIDQWFIQGCSHCSTMRVLLAKYKVSSNIAAFNQISLHSAHTSSFPPIRQCEMLIHTLTLMFSRSESHHTLSPAITETHRESLIEGQGSHRQRPGL